MTDPSVTNRDPDLRQVVFTWVLTAVFAIAFFWNLFARSVQKILAVGTSLDSLAGLDLKSLLFPDWFLGLAGGLLFLWAISYLWRDTIWRPR